MPATLRSTLASAFPLPEHLEEALSTDWVAEWQGWADFAKQLAAAPSPARRERQRVALLRALDRLLRNNNSADLPTDADRLTELEASGRHLGVGELHGQNDCLIDSLLQLAALATPGGARRGGQDEVSPSKGSRNKVWGAGSWG